MKRESLVKIQLGGKNALNRGKGNLKYGVKANDFLTAFGSIQYVLTLE